MGLFFSVVFLPHDDNGRATVWLGLALAVYAVLGLVNVQFSVPRRAESWLGLLMGTATGAITVATGIFVMPGTHCLPTQVMCKHRLPGLQLWRLPQRLSAWGWDNSRAAKIKAETFRLCFFVGLMLLGAHLALRGLL